MAPVLTAEAELGAPSKEEGLSCLPSASHENQGVYSRRNLTESESPQEGLLTLPCSCVLQACQLPRDTIHSITSRGRQSPTLSAAFWEFLHPRICNLRKIQAVSGKVRVPLAFEMMSSGESFFSFLFPGKAPYHLTCHVLGFMDPWRSADDHQAVSNVKLKFKTKKQNNNKKSELSCSGKTCHRLS